MKFVYQVIDEPVGKTYTIEADNITHAEQLICDEWQMLPDCIELLEAAE